MKKIFKIVVLTIGVFWGTIIIMEAKESVEKYVSKQKKELAVIETTNFISKKGKGFIDYIMMEITTAYEYIDEITNIIKTSKNIDKNSKQLQELQKINLGLKEIIEKKAFIGLDDFIIEVNNLSLLVDDYITLIEEKLDKDKNFNFKILKLKEVSIENAKINIEELIKTIEVN